MTLAPQLAVVAIVTGSAIRIQQFLTRRSLWADEAALAHNIVQRGFAELLQPLDANQGAPVLFLWAQRLAVVVGGNNEYALRLVPLVAGIALLVLVYLLGCRLASPIVGAGAVVLAAWSPTLVRYSTEVKQYSTDAAFTVALVLLGALVLDRPRQVRPLIALAMTGSVAVWFSHPAVFTLAGIGLVLAARAAWGREWSQFPALAAVGAMWALNGVLLVVISLRHLGDNEFLTSYWQQGFLPRPVTVSGTASWLASTTTAFIGDPVRLALPSLAVLAVVAGAVLLGRRQPWGALLLFAPVPFLLMAAVLELYPFQGRLTLFLVPVVLVGLASLIDHHRWRLLTIPLIAVFAAGAAAEVIEVTIDPFEIADSRPVFQHVGENWQDGDQLWVHDVAIEPYRYYAPIIGLTADRRTRWLDAAGCARTDDDQSLDLVAAAAESRVWVVFAYTLSSRPDDEVEILRRTISTHARILSIYSRHDASVTLFDFGAPDASAGAPESADGSNPPHPTALACLRTVPEPPVPRTGLATRPLGSGGAS